MKRLPYLYALASVLIAWCFNASYAQGMGTCSSHIQGKGAYPAADDSLHTLTDDRFDGLDDSSHIEAELETDSRSVFIGRYFGGNGLLYIPKFVYYNKSGLGFTIVNNSWLNSKTASAITDLMLNYSHTFGDRFDFAADYDYWFFNKDIKKQGLNNLVDVSGTFWFTGWANVSSDVTYMFGSQNGLLFHESAGLNFKVYPSGKMNRITIEPEAGVYIGDPSIYKKKTRPGTVVPLISNKFGMLDFYGAVKLTYQYKHMAFSLSYETDFPKKYKDKDGLAINRTDFFSVSVKRYFTWKNKRSAGK